MFWFYSHRRIADTLLSTYKDDWFSLFKDLLDRTLTLGGSLTGGGFWFPATFIDYMNDAGTAPASQASVGGFIRITNTNVYLERDSGKIRIYNLAGWSLTSYHCTPFMPSLFCFD